MTTQTTSSCPNVGSGYETKDKAAEAGHRPTGSYSLGYRRTVCEECRCDWPCPEFAQAGGDEFGPVASVASPMTTEEAVREVGWVAREAREMVDAMPSADAPADVRAAWQQRREAFMARKTALLEFIEADTQPPDGSERVTN